jgi:hypothetical protein
MNTYLVEQLIRFLEAVDAALDGPTTVVVIGGTAAALHYGVRYPTKDIDTWTSIPESLARAVETARGETGLEVPVTQSGIAEAPEGIEERLEPVLTHLKKLSVLVPEKHDLVLMKMLRADQHDLDAIAEIHRNSPVDLDVLIQRFENEMDPVGSPAMIRLNFLALIETLFPDEVDAVSKRLRAPKLP